MNACPACSQPIGPNDFNCPKCGLSLHPDAANDGPPAGNGKGLPAGVVVIVLMFFIIAGLGGLLGVRYYRTQRLVMEAAMQNARAEQDLMEQARARAEIERMSAEQVTDDGADH